MRRGAYRALALLLAAAMGALPLGCAKDNRTAKRAEERALAYAEQINYHYEEPEGIYPFLMEELRGQISQADFAAAFAKERSYPYLTPLFINFRSVELSGDGMSGTAYFSQAARLPGMVYTVGLAYENGDYYMLDFEELADGSYLEKFEDIPYSLDSYFDFGP